MEEINKKLLIFTIEEKMKASQSMMSQNSTSQSWTDQKKFEFYYGQYMAQKEIITMLNNM